MAQPPQIVEWQPQSWASRVAPLCIDADRNAMPGTMEGIIQARREDTNPFLLIDLSEVVRKHTQWTQLLPRVAVSLGSWLRSGSPNAAARAITRATNVMLT